MIVIIGIKKINIKTAGPHQPSTSYTHTLLLYCLVTKSCPPQTPWTSGPPGPSTMDYKDTEALTFSRNLPNSGSNLSSSFYVGSLLELPGKPHTFISGTQNSQIQSQKVHELMLGKTDGRRRRLKGTMRMR